MNLQSFYKNKRVLVTGHTGFKGSWLCAILKYLEADICGVALEPTSEKNLFDELDLANKMESHLCDIRNLEEVKTIFEQFQPEIVLHLAAQPLVIDSYNNPVYTYDVNVMGTVNVCECVRLCSSVKSFVNVTTDKVYKNIEQESYRYKEEDYLDGFDPYSNSKSCSELVTSSYIHSFLENIAVSTCRAGNVIGGGDFSINRIIPDCIKFTQQNEPIVLRNPNSIRPYQHVLEADMFYLLIAMKQYQDKSLASNYNIGPNIDDCITTGKLCDIFCQKWGQNACWQATDYNGPHEANFLMLSIDKANQQLNWQPKWNVEIAVEKTVEWVKEIDKWHITNQQIKEYLGKL